MEIIPAFPAQEIDADRRIGEYQDEIRRKILGMVGFDQIREEIESYIQTVPAELAMEESAIVVELQQGRLRAAIAWLEEALGAAQHGRLGLKYEAACRHNLGLAYGRSGRESEAVRELREVVGLFPVSIYARQAGRTPQERPWRRQDSRALRRLDGEHCSGVKPASGLHTSQQRSVTAGMRLFGP